jgi:hypothetical protein
MSKRKRPKKIQNFGIHLYGRPFGDGEDSASRKEIKAKSKLKYTEIKQNGSAKTKIESNSIFA